VGVHASDETHAILSLRRRRGPPGDNPQSARGRSPSAKAPGGSTAPPATAPSTATTPDNTATSPAGKGQGARGDILARLKEQLDLTPEQIEKIKPILEKQREQLKGLKDDTSLSQEQKRDKFRESIVSTLEEIKPLLTQEQLAKLKEIIEKRRAEREKNAN